MYHINKNPAGQGEVFENGKLDSLSAFQSSSESPENQPQTNHRLEYLRAMIPGADPTTLENRVKLRVGYDTAMWRMAKWNEWPEQLHSFHGLAAVWAGRASIAPWPMDDLERAISATRFLLAASILLRELEAAHGRV